MVAIPDNVREIIICGLKDQVNRIQSFVIQIEDCSRLSYGDGFSCQDLIAVEKNLYRIRRLVQKHKN